MAEANWFWADGDKRNGPVAPAAIARLVADGKLGPDDLIWKEGMPDWIPVRKVPALMKYAKVPAAAPKPVSVAPPMPVESSDDTNALPAVEEVATPVPAMQAVSYYNPSGAMPPRAAATLAKHAKPRGDVGDWPLDDARVAQFSEAAKYKGKIDAAALLYRILELVMLIVTLGFIVATVVAFSTARGSAAASVPMIMGIATAVCVGFVILYHFAYKATVRAQAWGSLTMGILYVLGMILQVLSIAMQSMAGNSTNTPAIASGILSVLLAAAFAYWSFGAFVAIPKYLRQPAWCQELLSKTGQK